MGKRSLLENKELLTKVVSKNYCISDVLREFNLVPAGSNFKTFIKYVNLYKIDFSHFDIKKISLRYNKKYRGFKDTEIFIKNSSYTNTNRLRQRLLKERKNQCEICKRVSWLKKTIKLELHHIDGNSKNNLKENLLLICPNCHSFTDNYRGKNIKVM